MTTKEIAEKLYNESVTLEIPDFVRAKGAGWVTAWVDDVRVSFYWEEMFGIDDSTIEIIE